MDGDRLFVFGRRETSYPPLFFDSKKGVITGGDIPITSNIDGENFSFSPLGTYFCCSTGIYRTSDWQQVRAGPVFSASFSSDEKYCSFGSAHSVFGSMFLVNTADWNTVLYTHSDGYAALSDDGQYLATLEGATVRLLSVPTFTLIASRFISGMSRYRNRSKTVGFSPSEPYMWAGNVFLSLPTLSPLMTVSDDYYYITAGKTGRYVAVTYVMNHTGLTIYDGVSLTPIASTIPIYRDASGVEFFDNDNKLILMGNGVDDIKPEIFETFNWTKIETRDISSIGLYKGVAICEAPGIIKSVRGIVKDRFGVPCRRLVYALGRTNPPTVLTSTYSDAVTGEYELRFIRTNDVVVVSLADDYEVDGAVLPDLGFSLRANLVCQA